MVGLQGGARTNMASSEGPEQPWRLRKAQKKGVLRTPSGSRGGGGGSVHTWPRKRAHNPLGLHGGPITPSVSREGPEHPWPPGRARNTRAIQRGPRTSNA